MQCGNYIIIDNFWFNILIWLYEYLFGSLKAFWFFKNWKF